MGCSLSLLSRLNGVLLAVSGVFPGVPRPCLASYKDALAVDPSLEPRGRGAVWKSCFLNE